MKRAIAPINPFAAQQIPTTDSVAVLPKFGERPWIPEVPRLIHSPIPPASLEIVFSQVTMTPSPIPDTKNLKDPFPFPSIPNSELSYSLSTAPEASMPIKHA